MWGSHSAEALYEGPCMCGRCWKSPGPRKSAFAKGCSLSASRLAGGPLSAWHLPVRRDRIGERGLIARREAQMDFDATKHK